MKQIFALLGAFIMVVFASCGSKEEVKEEKSRFMVTSPVRKDTSLTKEYVCQIRAYQHIELRALERGYIENIFVDEGQLVKKGQLMFQIMPVLYQAELQKAQAEANFAETEYKNTKALADDNIVSANELALVKAKLDKAKAELTLAQIHLQFTEVRAPFDGLMDHFHVRKGSLVEEGELITTLSDNSQVWVYFNVPEAEYLTYKTHVKKDSLMNVKLLMADNNIFDKMGTVTTIEADFNNETGNIAFRATFPNPDGLLRHGETGNVLMEVPIRNELLIPQRATYEVLDKRYVFTVGKDGEVKSKAVTITGELPHLFAIKDGIDEHDKILLEGLRKVREHDHIKYKFIDPNYAVTHLNLYAE